LEILSLIVKWVIDAARFERQAEQLEIEMKEEANNEDVNIITDMVSNGSQGSTSRNFSFNNIDDLKVWYDKLPKNHNLEVDFEGFVVQIKFDEKNIPQEYGRI